mgnify:FL=1
MKEEIIKKYLNGYSINKLLIEYPSFNRRQINKLLKENNITIRGGRKKREWSLEQKKELKEMLNKGSFLKDIAKYFNASEETIKNLMSEMNLELKTLNRVNRRINSNYFSIIDKPEKAYWLGFLFTDGCVDKLKTTGRIRL